MTSPTPQENHPESSNLACWVVVVVVVYNINLQNLSNPFVFSFLSGALSPAGPGLRFLGGECGPAGEPSDVWIKRLAFVLFCFNLPKETLISYTSKMLEKDVQSPRGCGAALGSGLARPVGPQRLRVKGQSQGR